MHANHFSSAWGTSNFQYHCRGPYKFLEGLSIINQRDERGMWRPAMMMMRRRKASELQKVVLLSNCFTSNTAMIESNIIPLSVLLSSIVFLQFNKQDAWSFTTFFSSKLVCTQYSKKCITWKFFEKKDWGIKQFWGKQKIRRSGGSSCMIMYWGCMLVKTCMGAHRQDMKFKEVLWRFSKIYWSKKQQTKQKERKENAKTKRTWPKALSINY